MRNNFYSITSGLLINLSTLAGTSAYAEEISETLKCKIKDTVIMAIEDGIPKRYSNFKNGFERNETLTLLIKFAHNSMWVDLSRANSDEPVLFSNFYNLKDTQKNPFPGEPKLRIKSAINKQISYIDADTMIFRSPKFSSPKLDMGRYYKSDWDGTFVTSISKHVQTAVLDCRTVGQSKMDQIIKVLTEAAEK